MKKENCLISSWRGRKKLRKQSGIQRNRKDSLSLHKPCCANWVDWGLKSLILQVFSHCFPTSFYMARI